MATFTGLLDGTALSATVSLAIPVPATPSGPATPVGGWTCVMADGFNAAHPLGQAASLFAANRNDDAGDNGLIADCGAFDPSEIEVFNASQVTLQPDGVHLRAAYSPAHVSPPGSVLTGQPAVSYVSGCLSSQPLTPTLGGQRGFGIRGFGFLPILGADLCFEILVTLPARDLPGGDMAFWASSPNGANEIDLMEWTDYTARTPPPQHWATQLAWIDWVNGHTTTGAAVYNNPAQTDGQPHRWTSHLRASDRTVRTYLDGTEIPDSSYPWLDAWEPVPLFLILSHSLRAAYPGQGPTFTDSTDAIVRSVACYQDAPHAGAGIIAGGISPGTILRSQQMTVQ